MISKNMDATCAASGNVVIDTKIKGGLFDALCFWGKKKQVVSVLRLSGVVGRARGGQGISFEVYEPLIDKAFKVCGCKAVILIINSPGGAPAQCEMIADHISRLSQETKIPVYSFVEDIAASAGYWLLATGDEVYANKNSLVGSIGVVYAGFGFVGAIHKLGIERRAYYVGKNKIILDPFQPEKEKDVAILNRMQEDIYENFKNYVMRRRRSKLRTEMDDIFSGLFWTGSMALELGLIDGINNYSRFIAERFGKNAKVVQIKKKQYWWTKNLSLKLSCDIDSIVDKIYNKLRFSKFDL